MKEKVYLFDLDGTLFNTNIVNYHAYKQALNDEGYDMTFEYYINECNGCSYKSFLPPISQSDEDFLNRIHNLKKIYYKKFISKAKPNIELINFIKQNKENGYMAIVTTASRENCMDILNHYKITNLFDIIITKENVQKTKPDPEGYNIAVEYFGIDKSNCEIFEDSENGIKAAMSAGIKYNVVYGYNDK